MARFIQDYTGSVDPTLLIPKIGLSYQHDEILSDLVNLINQWQFKTVLDRLDHYINNESAKDELAIKSLRFKGEILAIVNDFTGSLNVFRDILKELPNDAQALILATVLSMHLGEMDDKSIYLNKLRHIDLVLYTRLNALLNFIADNYGKFDMELGLNQRKEIQAIALFGHRFEKDGSMSSDLTKRLKKTLFLANKYPKAKIIVSGGAALTPVLEADCMAEWLIKYGVESHRIFKDPFAKDTVGNTIGIVKFLNKLNIDTCIAVTSLTHLPRAWMSLVACCKANNCSTEIYVAAPEPPNSVGMSEEERQYLYITVLRSAHLFEYRHINNVFFND